MTSRPINVEGFRNSHTITTDGVITSRFGRTIKRAIDKDGYFRVTLWNGNKMKNIGVHRAIALTFIPNINELPVVNHKDGNRQNNSIENLEWCTIQYNVQHSFDVLGKKVSPKCGEQLKKCNKKRRKFNEDQIKQIKESNYSQRVLGKMFNVSRIAIRKIKRGLCYKELNYAV